MKNVKKKLQIEKDELLKLEASLEGSNGLDTPLKEATGELSSYDNHPGDLATETYERSKDLGLKEFVDEQIQEVEEAQNAIEEGTYGYCHNCGQSISDNRLLALPRAVLCVHCQRDLEEQDDSFRPVEEESLFPPFGRGLDADDAWEAVARYGTSSYREKH